MYRACLDVLRDPDDAKDALQDAIATAIANPPANEVKNWEAWLFVVAQRAAKQYVRKAARQRAVLAAAHAERQDDDGACQHEEEIERLLTRATAMMTAEEAADFELYREVALTDLTQEELAAKRDLPVAEVRRRRRRALRMARDAIIAVYLAGNPGSGKARCTVPAEHASALPDSPVLRDKIVDHVRGCPVCRTKRAEPKKLLRRLLVVPGLGLAGALLARLLDLLTPKKVALAATVALVTVTVAVLIEDERRPAPPELVVVLPSSTPLTAPRPLPQPTTSEPPPAPPRAPEREPEPEPQAPPAPPEPVGEAHEDSEPPVIEGGWVEHRRLVVDEYGRCDDDAPRTTGVAALVRGARSVTVHLLWDGSDIPVPMTGVGGSGWGGHIDPAGRTGRYDVVVEAVGPDGATTREQIAELCVTSCGGRSS